MRYLAVIKIGPCTKLEKIVSNRFEAEKLAFESDGKLDKLMPLKPDYEECLAKETIIICKPDIRDNRH